MVNGCSSINWGSAPDWLAAVGTVGAFAVAIVLYIQSQADRKVERQHRFEVDQQQRRAQAARVSITEPEPGNPTQVLPVVVDQWEQTWSATVHNNTDEPINDVTVVLDIVALEPDPSGTVGEVDVIDIGRVMARREENVSQDYILPGRQDGEPIVCRVTAELDFTDSAGVLWHRDANHNLTERPATLSPHSII
jgi:hypothetical protein